MYNQDKPLAVIFVGLPARGKTHIARSLRRFLRWLGVPTEVFHLGDYRREISNVVDLRYFNHVSSDFEDLRKEISKLALNDLVQFLTVEEGQVGIYDASNITQEKRRILFESLTLHDIQILYIEVICDDPEVINANIRHVKTTSPDYHGWDPEKALLHFKSRIEAHEKYYETITDTSLSFIKLYNLGEKVTVNNVAGYLQSRIVFLLMNLHIDNRKIFLARNGVSTNETSNKDDAELNENGRAHALRIFEFITYLRDQKDEFDDPKRKLKVWTSTRKRSISSAQYFLSPVMEVYHRPQLVEINLGELEGLKEQEIKSKFPDEYVRALDDPFHYRFPRAESYQDLVARLEPILMELEHERDDVVIIGHKSVLRCLYAYFLHVPEQDIPSIDIQRDELIEITPGDYGCTERRINLLSAASAVKPFSE